MKNAKTNTSKKGNENGSSPIQHKERLTDDERERFESCIDFSKIKGTARQRVEMLNMVYAAFLQGVGYKPIGWREAETV